MRAYDVIAKKRDGYSHTREELAYLIQGYLDGTVKDEQMSAWLMAVYFQGMTKEETVMLTDLMEHSGATMDLSAIRGTVVDKHSTGGVGDKTTLVIVPLAAAAGVPIAKLSGRGLGFTGGTIDKLEAIPGFQTSIVTEAFMAQVNDIGAAVAGQTQNLVPADKKIYALRDVTATIESIPLIASSIMSKKLASGAEKIVLDVKFGNGAFMQEKEDALRLAQTMVDIGKGLNRQTVAVLSSMEEPLGYAVGNSLEVMEAVQTLQGKGPVDLTELCVTLAGYMIYLGGKAENAQAGLKLAQEILTSGQGLAKLREIVAAQGGNPETLDDFSKLPQAEFKLEVPSLQTGTIVGIEAKEIGLCSMLLGAGRENKESQIDLAAGVWLHKKIGDKVQAGESLATLYYSAEYAHRAEEVVEKLQAAYHLGENSEAKTLILRVLE